MCVSALIEITVLPHKMARWEEEKRYFVIY